ncbi:hypothetical protein BDV96DRAFT_581009 [Lophiotrema nucula]|uniref:Uncharacterized protein n=1 Tax=Lophiotrema nucula TaxID=690887 RepID=A0A6A5Z0V3_9PLEO|nr:hypothetical protein BDV96DRAFT_581009 [Lophiotrema nucula]
MTRHDVDSFLIYPFVLVSIFVLTRRHFTLVVRLITFVTSCVPKPSLLVSRY